MLLPLFDSIPLPERRWFKWDCQTLLFSLTVSKTYRKHQAVFFCISLQNILFCMFRNQWNLLVYCGCVLQIIAHFLESVIISIFTAHDYWTKRSPETDFCYTRCMNIGGQVGSNSSTEQLQHNVCILLKTAVLEIKILMSNYHNIVINYQ